MNGDWKQFNTKEEAKRYAERDSYKRWFNIQRVEFVDPGWYCVEVWTQRCPRNCCDDLCIRIFPAAVRVKEIKEEMRDLANDLKDARSKE